MLEAVRIGPQALPGEVVRIESGEITVQVYEDTTGLRPGQTIEGTGGPMSIRLGPGLLGRIFDGLLRPLSAGGSPYVEPGMRLAELGTFRFSPVVALGMTLSPGAVFGHVGTDLGQRCLVPAGVAGEVVELEPAGDYGEEDVLCQIRSATGDVHALPMTQDWPVRTPRPAAVRLTPEEPLITGQRILDSVFPVVRGGKACIPGGFGTGKTILLETLAKWCDADVIVYVGCGERGNEMAGLVHEFMEIEHPKTGKPLMDRTVIIANTSNMPVAAREASIYTGVTVAEYFRDQGFDVALMADSTSRWAEALRETAGRLGEVPGEGGYPPYLGSRLAQFYERAAMVETLAGERASVTIIGAVSPPSGDFSEPVVTHTKRYIRDYWALDARRAQARFYPAIDPLASYSEDALTLARWWEKQGNPEWFELRRRFLELLEQHSHLERMARILGKDALPPRQRLVLMNATLVNDAFLSQSAFSIIDRYASPARQSAMMRLLAKFFVSAEQLVDAGVAPESIYALPVYRRVQRMGEEIEEGQMEKYTTLGEEVDSALAGLRPASPDGESTADSGL